MSEFGKGADEILKEFEKDFKDQLTPAQLEKLQGKCVRLAEASRSWALQEAHSAFRLGTDALSRIILNR